MTRTYKKIFTDSEFYNNCLTLAVGSADFIALNAAKDAVPPPINKYGTSFGMSLELAGFLITPFFFLLSTDFFWSIIVTFLSSLSNIPMAYN